MSAFENIDSSTNQCSLLNRAGNLSNLWFNVPSAISVSSPSALANMFASGNGTLTTFSQAIAGLATTDLQNTILTSSEIKPNLLRHSSSFSLAAAWRTPMSTTPF